MADINNVISNIKSNKFQRQNLFRLETCMMGDPGKDLLSIDALKEEGSRVYIQSASTPESAVSLMEIPFQGRRIKLPGDRTFGQWTVTFLSDAEHTIKNELELWSDEAASLSETKRNIDKGMGEWTIQMLDEEDKPTKTFTIFNCVPLSVGASNVTLADANNFITFPVTLGYSHFRIDNP